MNERYPNVWCQAKLSDLVQIIRGVTYKKNQSSGLPIEGSIPVLRATNIQNDSLHLDDLVFIESSLVKDIQKIRKNDVVVAMSSGSKSVVGKTAQSKEDIDAGFGAFCCLLRPSEMIQPELIGFYTRSAYYRSRVSELSAGANINNLKPVHFDELSFPIPPLAEQKVIADKLDSLLAQVETTKARLDRVPDILKRFRQSVLAAAVSGRLTEEWREKNIHTSEDLIVEVGNARFQLWCESELEKYEEKGKVPPKNWKSKYKLPIGVERVEGIPQNWGCLSWNEISMWITYGFTKPMPHVDEGPQIITAKHVRHGKVDTKDAYRTTVDAFNSLRPKDKPSAGDLLIVKDGATTGRACIAPKGLGKYCISQSVAVVWLKHSPINRKYLLWNVQSPNTQRRIQGVMAGMAMPHLSITDFGKMPVPIPPTEELTEIVRRVEELFAFADAVEQKAQAASERVNKLTQSILAKAFRGELTADWRAANPDLISGENSAEALLEKIQAEREALKPKKKTRAKKVKKV